MDANDNEIMEILMDDQVLDVIEKVIIVWLLVKTNAL